MKRILFLPAFLLCLAVSVMLPVTVLPEEKTGWGDLNQAVKVDELKDVFQTGNVYIAGQPNLEALRWMKAHGVTLVINVRTETENKDFAATAFNEENMVKELGMTYFPLPIGSKESYSPQSVNKLAEVLQSASGKVLLHCASGGRVTYLWMAYLVRYQEKTIDQAGIVGRKMRFTLPVEDFLGTKITLTLEDAKK